MTLDSRYVLDEVHPDRLEVRCSRRPQLDVMIVFDALEHCSADYRVQADYQNVRPVLDAQCSIGVSKDLPDLIAARQRFSS